MPNPGRTERKARKRGGRPTVMTPEVCKKICRYISLGMPREQAASLAGVSADSLYRYQARNCEFCEAIKAATARFVRVHIQRIAKAGKSPKRWTASAWLLERLLPESFSKVDRHVLHATARGPELTEEYKAAIAEGFGFTGKLRPIGNALLPDKRNGELAALPQGDDVIDIEILPQD